MLDKLEPLLKIICLVLAALLLGKIAQRALHVDPLGHASIPPLPTLAVQKDKDTTPVAADPKPSIAAVAGTNSLHATNATIKTNLAVATNSTLSNALPTNASLAGPGRHSRHGGGGASMPGGFPLAFGGPQMPVKLPPGIQSRVDRVRESEILGPVMHPMPMALLGIADDDAFLRGPDGQTGMVKEGGELGGVKLLRIGINRVLVEENGEKKELTLFNGFGGDSLLPPATNSSTNASIMPKQKGNL